MTLRTYIAQAVIVMAAALVCLPLLLHGPSCGHDFLFHIQSWLDAAAQLRHGRPWPRWTFSAAWNAGEPRFLFYPPLSWLLGALLALSVPARLLTDAFTLLALAAAGLSFHALARRWVSAPAALVGACFYLANPYTLFTAFERTAYAELLAAAVFPWLLRGLLEPRMRVRAVAVPLALLWLTNAPAGIMGMYAVALLVAVRVLWQRGARLVAGRRAATNATPARTLLARTAAALVLGCALAAVYLLPAAVEQRSVQVALANGPGYDPAQSMLFAHTADVAHDRVLHTADNTGALLLAAAALACVILWLARQRHAGGSVPSFDPGSTLPAAWLAVPAAVIACMQLRFTLPLWRHLPELHLLQFPWRLLAPLAVLSCLLCTLALDRLLPQVRSVAPKFALASAAALSCAAALACAAALSRPALATFRQPCDATDLPAARAALFAEHHGVAPTDEYTPLAADNDSLRTDEPPFWLAADNNTYGPHSTPNPHETDPNGDFDDIDVPAGAQLQSTPLHFSIDAPAATNVVVNLRAFPDWRVQLNGAPAALEPRDDGLITFPVPAGRSRVEIAWHATWDQWLGPAISLLALAALLVGTRRRARP